MNEWDFVKGVLIILVIWGHICAYTSGVSYEKNALTTYIRLFQMPAFIFVSGFFQKKISTIAQFVEVTKNNIISIGVPYVVWTVVYFVLYTVANAILKNEYNFSFKSIAASFAFLWFFGCLLFCQFLFGCISIVNEKMKWGGTVWVKHCNYVYMSRNNT